MPGRKAMVQFTSGYIDQRMFSLPGSTSDFVAFYRQHGSAEIQQALSGIDPHRGLCVACSR